MENNTIRLTGEEIDNAIDAVSIKFADVVSSFGQLPDLKQSLESLPSKKRFLRADFIRNKFYEIEMEILRIKELSEPRPPQRHILTGELIQQDGSVLDENNVQIELTPYQLGFLGRYLTWTKNFIALLSNIMDNEITCSLGSSMKDDTLPSQHDATAHDAAPSSGQQAEIKKVFENKTYPVALNQDTEKILQQAVVRDRVRISSGKIVVNNYADAFNLEFLLCFPSIKKGRNERMAEYFSVMGKDTLPKDWKTPRYNNKNPDTKAFLREIGMTK